MEINEISIVTKSQFNIGKTVDVIIKLFKLNVNKIHCTEMNDWLFCEVKKCNFHNYELSNLQDKIIVIEIFTEIKNPHVIYIYKENKKYVIDINFASNAMDFINKSIIEKLILLMNNDYIVIAFGDDFLIDNYCDTHHMIESSSGVEFWIINNNYDYIDYEIIYKYDNRKNYEI